MNTLIVSFALLLSAGTQTDPSNHATLVGHQFKGAVAGSPVLVCVYDGASAKFEIVSESGKCAPSIEVR